MRSNIDIYPMSKIAIALGFVPKIESCSPNIESILFARYSFDNNHEIYNHLKMMGGSDSSSNLVICAPCKRGKTSVTDNMVEFVAKNSLFKIISGRHINNVRNDINSMYESVGVEYVFSDYTRKVLYKEDVLSMPQFTPEWEI